MGKKIILPKDLDEDVARAVLDRARDALDIPTDAEIRIENVVRTERSTRIYFTYTTSVELHDANLEAIGGVRVNVTSRGDLRFNSKGILIKYEIEPVESDQLRAVRENLRRLVAANQIYVAAPGEAIDPERLLAEGKAWYVEQDAHGKKLLRRASISQNDQPSTRTGK